MLVISLITLRKYRLHTRSAGIVSIILATKHQAVQLKPATQLSAIWGVQN
jgi:hypothetical protein